MSASRPGRPDDDPLQRWQTVVDRAIREAQGRGDFDDLPHHGKPLPIDDNPFAGDRALGFHVLKNAGVLPYWLQLDKEIGADHAALTDLRERTARRLAELRPPSSPTAPGSRPPVPPTAGRDRPARLVRWWPFRRNRHPAPPVEGTRRPDPASVEADRRRARRTYLERAARLDEKIRRYNNALPHDLRWRERPRLTPDQAARDFDAACPPHHQSPASQHQTLDIL